MRAQIGNAPEAMVVCNIVKQGAAVPGRWRRGTAGIGGITSL